MSTAFISEVKAAKGCICRKGEITMDISGKTRLYGLLGSPVQHSKSPAMYNYCFQKWGLDSVYLAFEVQKEDIREAVWALRTLRMKGANVTMPCKQAIVPWLDEISPAVRLSGACNTVVEKEGKLWGYNTDGEGYVADLKEHGVEIAQKRLTVLGAGGASTAIQVQSLLDGAAKISVFNQKDAFWETALRKVEALQEAFPNQQIRLYDLADQQKLADEIADSDVLTNATRVGMKPLDQESNIRDLSLFRPDLVVTDTIYEPRETKMLAQAKERGCKTIGGLGMLLHQGAAAVKLYTGREMPLDEIRRIFF